MSRPIHVLGLMSGSSLDGLDMALCSFTGGSPSELIWNCLSAETVPFDSGLKTRLSEASTHSAKELLKLEVDFTSFCAKVIRKFQEDFTFEIDYIAHHGHTLFHFPELGFTHQIVNGAQLAAVTGRPSIVDFRSQDIAMGGQGAPIAPIVEQWLLTDYNLFLNLGGIANLSIHQPDGDIIAYDVCPCNQTLNNIVSELDLEYDNGGALAAQGKIIPELLSQWSSIPYFSAPFPKSLDNNWCRDQFTIHASSVMGSVEDRLRTTVEFITTKITEEFTYHLESRNEMTNSVLVSGGGAYNSYMIEALAEKVKSVGMEVVLPEEQIINYKEAILMALMGYLRVNNIPNTIPSVTGASSGSVGGAMYDA